MSDYEYAAHVRAWFKESQDWFVDGNRKQYQNGEKEALIRTIAVCRLFQMELPTWAREAVIKAYFGPRVASWDEVFGRPLPRGKSVTAHRRRKRIEMAAIGLVRELHSQGESIGPGLFEKVGKELGASAGTISSIYYDKETAAEFDRRDQWEKVRQIMFSELGCDADFGTQTAWVKQNLHRFRDKLVPNGPLPRRRKSRKG